MLGVNCTTLSPRNAIGVSFFLRLNSAHFRGNGNAAGGGRQRGRNSGCNLGGAVGVGVGVAL